MSYKVILVDCDQFYLDQLTKTIPWQDLDLELVATAKDGIEGEALIRRVNPDIVITEAILPRQNGVQMLAATRAVNSVIVSSSTDYEYTRPAIQLGVFDYLKKSLIPEQIVTVLTALVAHLDAEGSEASFPEEVIIESEEEVIPLPHTASSHIVSSAITFIEKNYSLAVGLQETARHLEISESHLSRLFKEETGLSFIQYLNAVRINKAAVMMKDSSKNINDIATGCGFPTPGYFSKIFKQFSGYTPTAYRNLSRKK